MRNSDNKHVNGQGELSLGLVFRRAVCTLLRWRPSRVLVGGRFVEGGLAAVTHSDWLAFYTPLCERG